MTPMLAANALRMCSVEHSSSVRKVHYGSVKTRELTPEQILSVPCPTCGAAIEEICELQTGAPRTEPHRDRKLSAAEAVETNPANDSIRHSRRLVLDESVQC